MATTYSIDDLEKKYEEEKQCLNDFKKKLEEATNDKDKEWFMKRINDVDARLSKIYDIILNISQQDEYRMRKKSKTHAKDIIYSNSNNNLTEEDRNALKLTYEDLEEWNRKLLNEFIQLSNKYATEYTQKSNKYDELSEKYQDIYKERDTYLKNIAPMKARGALELLFATYKERNHYAPKNVCNGHHDTATSFYRHWLDCEWINAKKTHIITKISGDEKDQTVTSNHKAVLEQIPCIYTTLSSRIHTVKYREPDGKILIPSALDSAQKCALATILARHGYEYKLE